MARSDGYGSTEGADLGGEQETPQADEARLDGRRPRHRPLDFSLALNRDPAAAGVARQAIREHLGDILPAATVADVSLIVSELVTNAVLHGTGTIELQVTADDQQVTGGVRDEGTGFQPPSRARVRNRPGGLGLFIVDQLCATWGADPDATHVWFELPVIRATAARAAAASS